MLLLLFQGLSGCGSANQSNQTSSAAVGTAALHEEHPATDLVLAFGDSLYAGYRLGPKEGFVPQLQAALRKEGINAKVHNAGVSGDTSAAGRARLTFVLGSLERKPDLVVLGLGGNDMLRGIKPEQTRANLSAILDELKRRKIKVVLTGILASPNMGLDFAGAFNGIFPALAKQYGAPLYPFFLDGIVTDPTLMLDDGLHPNAKGLARVVAKVEPVVAAALRSGSDNQGSNKLASP
jgi:acyl-CoA thioesterase I